MNTIKLFVCLCTTFCMILANSCSDNEYVTYEEHLDHHTAYYTLPKKYKLIEPGKSPGIYYDMQYVRDSMHIFYSDTVRRNYFLVENMEVDTSQYDFSFIEQWYLDQTPFLRDRYDKYVENMNDGNTKYIFVAFRPRRCWMLRKDLFNEVVVELNLHCMVKTSDNYCFYFKIQSHECLKDFDYNEKMDIIKSIHVK